MIQSTGDKVELVYGQETPWKKCTCPVLVLKDSYFGQLFPQSKDTHFSAWQSTWSKLVVPVKDLAGNAVECPASYFSRIEAIAVEARRQEAQRRAVTEAAQAHRRAKLAAQADPPSDRATSEKQTNGGEDA